MAMFSRIASKVAGISSIAAGIISRTTDPVVVPTSTITPLQVPGATITNTILPPSPPTTSSPPSQTTQPSDTKSIQPSPPQIQFTSRQLTTFSRVSITATPSDTPRTVSPGTTLSSSAASPVSRISNSQPQAFEGSSTITTSSSFAATPIASLNDTSTTPPTITSSSPLAAQTINPSLSAGARAGLGIGVTFSTISIAVVAVLIFILRRRKAASQSDSSADPKAGCDDARPAGAGRWWKKDEILHEVVELKGEERTEFELEGDTHLDRRTAV